MYPLMPLPTSLQWLTEVAPFPTPAQRTRAVPLVQRAPKKRIHSIPLLGGSDEEMPPMGALSSPSSAANAAPALGNSMAQPAAAAMAPPPVDAAVDEVVPAFDGAIAAVAPAPAVSASVAPQEVDGNVVNNAASDEPSARVSVLGPALAAPLVVDNGADEDEKKDKLTSRTPTRDVKISTALLQEAMQTAWVTNRNEEADIIGYSVHIHKNKFDAKQAVATCVTIDSRLTQRRWEHFG